MVDKNDIMLDAMLDSYRVPEADPALLEQILTQARQQQQAAQKQKIFILFYKQALALAACAMFGFWMGAATLQTAEGDSLEPLIFGSTEIEEILL